MKWMLLVALAACGPGLSLHPPKGAPRDLLVRDAETLENMMQGEVTNGGLHFDDPACHRQFGHGGRVIEEQFGAFARCLAGLHLAASPRSDALLDVVVLQYAPGFELQARVTHENQLMWIGFASRAAGDPDVPTITNTALEGLRLAGDRTAAPPPEVASTLELDMVPGSASAFTWYKLCLDRTGAITKAEPFETTSEKASRAFGHALAAWRFRPFATRGVALPVCALIRLAYPVLQTAETLPLPPPPSRSQKRPLVLASSKLLEGTRLSGETAVSPDDVDKLRLQQSGKAQLRGTFRLCIDDTGAVESVLPLTSTGIVNYDVKIMRKMHDWRYRPYQVDAQPVPVCTKITVIYDQGGTPVRVQR